jgi:hypothetical protein
MFGPRCGDADDMCPALVPHPSPLGPGSEAKTAPEAGSSSVSIAGKFPGVRRFAPPRAAKELTAGGTGRKRSRILIGLQVEAAASRPVLGSQGGRCESSLSARSARGASRRALCFAAHRLLLSGRIAALAGDGAPRWDEGR